MKYVLILILLILSIILFIKIIQSPRETFDGKLENIQFVKCVEKCRNTKDCLGLSYDKFKKRCYISKNFINKDQPLTGVYKEYYSVKYPTCNKIFTDTYDLSDVIQRRDASIFVCGQDITKRPKMYYLIKGELQELDEGQNLDYLLLTPDKFSYKQYTWPTGDPMSISDKLNDSGDSYYDKDNNNLLRIERDGKIYDVKILDTDRCYDKYDPKKYIHVKKTLDGISWYIFYVLGSFFN